MSQRSRIALWALAFGLLSPPNGRAQAGDGARPVLEIRRVTGAPTLEDFRGMQPSPTWVNRLTRISDFVQTRPRDGERATERTDAYLGYNDERLFVIFVAFDRRPGNVRARKARREDLSNDDDWVEVAIDTFDDRRRAYLFDANPLGVQWDALWTEGLGEDPTFDTVYDTDGMVTDAGYVVWMAIPFRSLRFPARAGQTWGIQLRRFMPRVPELVAWPHMSARIQGRLNQAAALEGLRDISPGRNIQLIPYGTFRSFRVLEAERPTGPGFVSESFDANVGLDAKLILKDSFVFDVTANPDFSQVESDSPQVTANQRFEVFFPEKRPFFLENTTFFQTPLNLVFTRRIANPQIGVRLTGKQGPYAVGALVSDDRAPGQLAPPGDPARGRRAGIAIARVSRDIGAQSNLGVIYADRELAGGYNRVGGADGLFKVGRNWTGSVQAVASATRTADGRQMAGPAYRADVIRNGRRLNFEAAYEDIAAGFVSRLGFVNRTGFRSVDERLTFRFRPEGPRLIAWGPNLAASRLWARDGTRLDWQVRPGVEAELIGQTTLGAFVERRRERLRPVDVVALANDVDLPSTSWGLRADTSVVSWASVRGLLVWGQAVNFVPPAGVGPFVADETRGSLRISLRPATALRIQTDYLLATLRAPDGAARIFDNHILRSNWNWQFTRELSLRFIAQYEALLANRSLTRLPTTKRINADVLLTYRLNPWTALFVGYNTNAQNLQLCEAPDASRSGCARLRPGERALIRTDQGLLNDGRQFFVKLSYLFRF